MTEPEEMRDVFAILILSAIIQKDGSAYAWDSARKSYEIADIMLKVREEK
jgi:hypothetical protein